MGHPLLRLGSRGPDVTLLQQALNLARSALAKLQADGIFGPKTHGRVVEFQQENRLQVDGIVGNQTHLALEELYKLIEDLVLPTPPGERATRESIVKFARFAANVMGWPEALPPPPNPASQRIASRVGLGTPINAQRDEMRQGGLALATIYGTAGHSFAAHCFHIPAEHIKFFKNNPKPSARENEVTWRAFAGRSRMRFVRWLFVSWSLLGLLVACAGLRAEQPESARPNIVLVLCDDLGYGDLGCYGHDVIRTPNIDQFAAGGLKLTNCYAAAPNCSPARAGLMTGRTPYRVGVYNWIPFLSPMHLPEEEVTVAELLREGGYETCVVGKWHLNGWFNLPGQPQPSDMGFSHWFATQNNCLPNHRHPYNFVRNGIPAGPLKGYASHLVADEAIRWLREIRDPEKPFFLYVSFHEPHEPIATDPDYAALYGPREQPSLAAHHGNITQMDAAFGRLLEVLDESGLRDTTFLFFTSDNGPALTRRHPHGSSGPLRSHKGTLWEGGIRVPGIVQWPGVTRPGTVHDQPVSGVDLLPTLCALAGLKPPEDRILDGANVLPLFRGEPVERRKPLYWQFNYRRDWPQVAMRDGDWKLLASLTPADQGNLTDITSERMRQLKSCELDEFQLYNLADDVGETMELSRTHPDQLRRMVREMREMFTEVREAGPVWPEWTFPGYEGQRIEWPDYPIP